MCELEATTTAHNHPVEYEKEKAIIVTNLTLHQLLNAECKIINHIKQAKLQESCNSVVFLCNCDRNTPPNKCNKLLSQRLRVSCNETSLTSNSLER